MCFTRPLLADVTDDVAAAGQKLSSGAWEPLYLSADSLIGFNHHDDDRCDGALRLRFKNEHGTAVCRGLAPRVVSGERAARRPLRHVILNSD